MNSNISGMIKPTILRTPPSVDGSFGGSQMWLASPLMQNCGCGVIAGLDTVMRLTGEGKITREEYLKRFDEAARYIRPVMLPGKHDKPRMIFGNEFMGSFGVTAGRFKRGTKKYAASLGIRIKIKCFILNYEKKVKEYLEMGIPVVALLTAPLCNIMIVNCNGAGGNINFHWVTCTGIDDKRLEVSSWGEKYYIDLANLDKVSVGVKFYAILPE